MCPSLCNATDRSVKQLTVPENQLQSEYRPLLNVCEYSPLKKLNQDLVLDCQSFFKVRVEQGEI